MSDLISRIDAISVLEIFTQTDTLGHTPKQIVEALPSAHPLNPCETCLHKGKGWDEDPCDGCTGVENKYEPDNGWIPVSERLPEDGQSCLVTYSVTYSNGCVEIATFAEDLYDVDEYNFHDRVGVSGWFYFDDEYGYLEYSDVIAWMSLPKPYGGEK